MKTQYKSDKSGLEKKIDDADKKIRYTNGLDKKQIIMLRPPNVTVLATTAAIYAVENKKYPSDVIKKIDYGAKVSNIETKNFTKSDYNKLMRD